MSEVTRDDLAAALDGFRLAVRTHAGYQESGTIACPDEVAGALHATLSRIAAERSPDRPAKAAGDDPYVRETGRLEDERGRVVIVGVCYDTVTLRTLLVRPGQPPAACGVELDSAKVEELAQLLVAATWQAAWQTAESLARAGIGGAP